MQSKHGCIIMHITNPIPNALTAHADICINPHMDEQNSHPVMRTAQYCACTHSKATNTHTHPSQAHKKTNVHRHHKCMCVYTQSHRHMTNPIQYHPARAHNNRDTPPTQSHNQQNTINSNTLFSNLKTAFFLLKREGKTAKRIALRH